MATQGSSDYSLLTEEEKRQQEAQSATNTEDSGQSAQEMVQDEIDKRKDSETDTQDTTASTTDTSSSTRMAGDAVSQSSNSDSTTSTDSLYADKVANFDSEKYYGKRTDVSKVYDEQSSAGLAGDGTEEARVNAMNKFYGTDYGDVGDFSKDQFGYWHTQHHADTYASKGQGGDYYQRMAGDAITEPITPAPTPTPTPTPAPTQSAAPWSPNYDDVVFNGGANQTNQKGSTTIYDFDNNKYTYSYDAGKNGSFSYTITDQNGKTYNYEDLDDLARMSIERYANPNYGNSPTPTPEPTTETEPEPTPTPDPTTETNPTPTPSVDIDDSFNEETNIETNIEDNNIVTDNTLEEGAAITAGDESATVGGNNDVEDIQNQDKEFNFTMGNNGVINNWGNLNSDLSINFNWNEMFNANAGNGKDSFNQAESIMNNSATALAAIDLNNNLSQRDPNQFMNSYMQGLQMSGLSGNSFEFQQFSGVGDDESEEDENA